MNGSEGSDTGVEEKPQHLKYLQEFRTTQCQLFLQHKCTQHRPFTCFNWHFANQRRRRPFQRKDGVFNYNPDSYCPKYNENTGICPDGDDCQLVHRTAGDTERRYHPRYYKTATCVHETDSENHCVKNGPHCAFAHSAKDLRQPIYDAREKAEKSVSGNGAMHLEGILMGSGMSNGAALNSSVGKSVKSERDKDDKDKEVVVDDLRWNDLQYVLINYKTELCRKPPRQCRQGYACPMYHNNKDRRRSPRKFKYRSTPCPNVKHGDEWGDPSHCDLGDNCAYCHTRTEQQFHAEVYKSTKCNDVLQTGRCPRGPFCAFAHSDQELSMDRTAAIASDESTHAVPLSAGAYSAAVAMLGSSSQFDSGQTPPAGKISPEGSTSGLSLRSSSMSETMASLEYVAALQQQHLQQQRNSNGSSQLPHFQRFSGGSSAVSPGVPIRQGNQNADVAAAVHALSQSWNALSFLPSVNQSPADVPSISSGLGGGVTGESPPDVVNSMNLSQAGMGSLWGNSSNRRAVAIAARQKLGRSMSLNAPMGPISPRSSGLEFNEGRGLPLLVPSEEPDDFDLTSIDKELLSASSTGQQSTADRLGLSSSRLTHDSGDSTDSINGLSQPNGNSAVWVSPPNSTAAAGPNLGSSNSLSGSMTSGVNSGIGVNDSSVFLPGSQTSQANQQMPLGRGPSVSNEASGILQAFGNLPDQPSVSHHRLSQPNPGTEGWPGFSEINLDQAGNAQHRMRSLSSSVYSSGYSASSRASLNLGDSSRDVEDLASALRRSGLLDAVNVEMQQNYEREIHKLRHQNSRLLIQLKELGGDAAVAGTNFAPTDDTNAIASQLVDIRNALLENLSTVNSLLLAHMTCSSCSAGIGVEQPQCVNAVLMPRCAHAFCGRCNAKMLTCPICTANGSSANNSLNGRMSSKTAMDLRTAANAAANYALDAAARRRHSSAGTKPSGSPFRQHHFQFRGNNQFHPYQLKSQQPVLSNNSAAENQSPTQELPSSASPTQSVQDALDSARENNNAMVNTAGKASTSE